MPGPYLPPIFFNPFTLFQGLGNQNAYNGAYAAPAPNFFASPPTIVPPIGSVPPPMLEADSYAAPTTNPNFGAYDMTRPLPQVVQSQTSPAAQPSAVANTQASTLFRPPPMPNLPSYAGAAAPTKQTTQPKKPFDPNAALTYNANEKYTERYAGTKTGTTTGAGPNPNTTPNNAPPNPNAPQGEMWTDSQGNKHHKDYHINYAYNRLDNRLYKGFTDEFIGRMGVDPIRFYMREFVNDPRSAGWDLPDARGANAREFLTGMAAYAAESDAKFHPGAIAEWRRLHGNTEIPQEQWETWHRIAMATGGEPLRVGVGENPWGVY